jgi:IS1 family transposase
MNVLPFEKQVRIIAALSEGCGINATGRMVDVDKHTVMSLQVRVGEACQRLHDARMRNLNVSLLELDEAWSYIRKHQRFVVPGDPASWGDCYIWVALDATNKAIVSYRLGRRDYENANALAADLRARILNRPQITSDGLVAYINAIEQAFGADCDYAMLQKEYASVPGNDAAHRYSPGAIIGVEKRVIMGNPDEEKISTSYVERQNLTLRMGIRRMTRLTNAYSKKFRNHAAAMSLHVAFYNFCRVHETLRITPAMAIGVTKHIWTVGELIHEALNAPVEPPAPTAPVPPTLPRDSETGLLAGRRPFRLQVIRGGKLTPRRS